jgi:hypothetical protein
MDVINMKQFDNLKPPEGYVLCTKGQTCYFGYLKYEYIIQSNNSGIYKWIPVSNSDISCSRRANKFYGLAKPLTEKIGSIKINNSYNNTFKNINIFKGDKIEIIL